jgi:hypothetical protein
MDYSTFKEVFADVMPILLRAAPIIGTYVGSPSTGLIMGLLGAVAGENPCDHCALADKLKNDPDLFHKLQKLESTHSEWLKKES